MRQILEMGQIQDRCIHNNTFRQMRDSDLHTWIYSQIYRRIHPTDLQADLQMDLQAMIFKSGWIYSHDLQVHRQGLEATLQQNSSLVSFKFQADTSTERENS